MLTLANQGGKYAAGRLTHTAPTLAPPTDGTARYLLSEVLLIVASGPPSVERRTAEGAALRALINYQLAAQAIDPAYVKTTPPTLTAAQRAELPRLLVGRGTALTACPLPAGPGCVQSAGAVWAHPLTTQEGK